MIRHYLKRVAYQLVLCKQLKTVFIAGDTGLAVLPMKISFFQTTLLIQYLIKYASRSPESPNSHSSAEQTTYSINISGLVSRELQLV